MRISSKPLRKHRQQMVQIGFRIEPVGLHGLQNGEDDHASVGAGLRVAEQPVLPANYNGTNGVLHLVVADFDFAVVEECAKVLPLVQGVDNGFLQFAGRAEDCFQPGIVLFNN